MGIAMSIAEVETQTTAETTAKTPGETCPRCHTTKSWGQMSWCPDCGFYPVVDKSAEDGTSWADNLPDLPQEEEDDSRTALESIPAWFWGLLGGIVAIAGFSVFVRASYPDDEEIRGTVALLQLSLGFVSMFIAHAISAKFAMKSDRRVNFNDVLLSWFNIWQPTISALPHTCKRIWAFVWGGIAVITAVTVIGGIDYSAPFRTHKSPELKPLSVVGAVAGAARAGADDSESMDEALGDLQSQVSEAGASGDLEDGGPKSMEDALNELGNMEDQLEGLDTEELAKLKAAAKRKELECFIYGVVVDDRNVPTKLLFASNILGTEQHVAELDVNDLPRDKFRIIAVRLYKEVRRTPAIPSELQAIWVKPTVVCRLTFAGETKNGKLDDPKFDAIVVNQPGRYNSSRFEGRDQSQR